MLLQFTVENFLSFRDETVVRFTPAPSVEHRPGQLIRGEGALAGLRVAAFYGANASGKSNLFKALRFVRELVVHGRRRDEAAGATPFRPATEREDQPSKFELEVQLGATRWSYGVACTKARIEAEWLYRDAGQGEELMFSREAAAPGEATKIELGAALKTSGGHAIYEVLSGLTGPSQAFLFRLGELEANDAAELLRWLGTSLVLVAADQSYPDLEKHLASQDELRAWVGLLLHQAGTGVQQVLATLKAGSRPAVHLRDAFMSIPPEDDNIQERLSELIRSALEIAEPGELEITFFHALRNSDPNSFGPAFKEHEESDGTRRLLHLAPHLAGLRADGPPATVFIDELDRSLHALLTRRLIELYLSQPDERPNQLLFTTHDTNLLDAELLPPDAIYFVEKDPAGASSVYSLAEFKPEQLSQLQGTWERGYLSGRFGAIPFLGDPERLGWKKEPR